MTKGHSDLHTRQWRDVRTLFAKQLAARLGRTAREICEEGLEAGDFRVDAGIEVILEDGSTMSLRHAFAVVDEEAGQVGIFTEHCGYFCFRADDLVVRELLKGKRVAERRW